MLTLEERYCSLIQLHIQYRKQTINSVQPSVDIGEAIDIFFSDTNVQSEDIFPIQFVEPNTTRPTFCYSDLDTLDVNITFDDNTLVVYNSLQSIYAAVFYLCSWYPYTLVQINFDMNSPIFIYFLF